MTIERILTFLDAVNGPNNTAGFVCAFAILSASSFVSVFQGLWETSRSNFLKDRYSTKILFPWASFVQFLENATLAYNVSGNHVGEWWQYTVYVLQATVPPSLLLSSFDVTYSIHKTRSIQFCGIVDGQTRSKNPQISMLLKVYMRMVALMLLGVGISVNFNLIQPSSNLAGRVGWYYVVTQPWTDESVHIVLGVLPIGVVALTSLYFAMALWRYGTTYSMVVHASPFNPWFSPFFGTCALLGGQWFGERWYPLLSNLGIFVYVECVLLLFMEVNKDMAATFELAGFLDEIGKSKQPQDSSQHQNGDGDHNTDEENGHEVTLNNQEVLESGLELVGQTLGI